MLKHCFQFLLALLLQGLILSRVGPTAVAAEEGLRIPDHIEFRSGVSYREGGGNEWKLDYATPRKTTESLPAIVIIHGGGWVEGDKSSFDQLCVDWAGLGFFAMTINYRLASESQSTFPQAIEDCKCAIRWLRAHARQFNIDGERIGVYGGSAGGHLALMLGTLCKCIGDNYEGDGQYLEQPSDVCAVASDSGVINLDQTAPGNATLFKAYNQFLGGNPPARDIVEKASPLSYVDRAPSLPPLLLIYGTADIQVPIQFTDQFAATLQTKGIRDMTYIRYEGVDHCPFFTQKAPGAREEMEKFIIRTIKNKNKPSKPSPMITMKTVPPTAKAGQN